MATNPGTPQTALRSPETARAVEYLPLVSECIRTARSRFYDLPGDTTLHGVGREALWRAVLRYDAERGASFRTYAYYRVMGSIRDARRRPFRSRDALDVFTGQRVAEEVLAYSAGTNGLEGSPEERADQLARVRTLLRRARGRIDSTTRAIVLGHVVEGHTLRSLATQMDMGYRTVLKRYRKAVEALREVALDLE